MPINPASAQSFDTKYPYYRPGFGENFANMANAFLQGQQQRQQTQQEQYAKLFPVLAEMHMLKPGQTGQPGNQQFGGMPWQVTSPTQTPTDEANIEAKKAESAHWMAQTKNLEDPKYKAAEIVAKMDPIKLLAMAGSPDKVDEYRAKLIQSLAESMGGSPTADKSTETNPKRQKAIDVLTKNKKPINEVNIKWVIDNYGDKL